MRLIFLGSGEFGLPTLEALTADHEVAAVVTQPDRPAGRKQQFTPTPIGRWAQAQGLIVLICFGVGMLMGNFFNVKLIDVYSTVEMVNGVEQTVSNWDAIWMITTIISVVILVGFWAIFKDDLKDVKATEAA